MCAHTINKLSPLHVALLSSSLLLTATHSQADELRMKNGSVLIGEVIRIADDQVTFSTPFAGTIKINQDNINLITTDEPVTIRMEDGTVYNDKQIVATEDAMLVKSENETPSLFDATDIDMVNPEPWELGEGYDWGGRMSLAIEFENGNSDTEEWDLKLKTIWKSIYDRYTYDANFEYEEANGTKKEDNWDTSLKYDRFLEPNSPNYRGVKIYYDHDEFTDIKLRSAYSGYIGREFLQENLLTLTAEVGLVWVDENFYDANDENWGGTTWQIDLSSDFLGHGITSFIEHDAILRIEDPSDTIIDTTIGIRVPLPHGLEFSLEAEFEYDGGSPSNVEDLDETYNMRLGYVW